MYGDESIAREATKGIQNVNSLSSQVSLFKLYRKELASEEGLILPGFGDVSQTFYEID